MSLTRRWSEAGYLSRIVLSHAPRQASGSLIFDVRQKDMRLLSIILRTTAYAPLIGVAVVACFGLGIEDLKLRNTSVFVATAGFVGLVTLTISTKTERTTNTRFLAAWILLLFASSILYTLVNGRTETE
jgi:hypothetical protein